jgi:hypothetical protein
MSRSGSAQNDERWSHLVGVAFRLDEANTQGDPAVGEALSMIDSALEVFTSGTDPVEDFEGYAVRRLLLGLRGALVRRVLPQGNP